MPSCIPREITYNKKIMNTYSSITWKLHITKNLEYIFQHHLEITYNKKIVNTYSSITWKLWSVTPSSVHQFEHNWLFSIAFSSMSFLWTSLCLRSPAISLLHLGSQFHHHESKLRRELGVFNIFEITMLCWCAQLKKLNSGVCQVTIITACLGL